MQLEMYPKQDFKPVHNEQYIMFVVDDMYGNIEFKHYRCEIHYVMMDADDGFPVPCSVCYNGQDDLPFDTPLIWNKELDKYEVLTEDGIQARKCHKDSEQRFWMEKSWMLCGRGSMDQIQPHELDTISLGIALQSDFMKTICEANKVRKENKT